MPRKIGTHIIKNKKNVRNVCNDCYATKNEKCPHTSVMSLSGHVEIYCYQCKKHINDGYMGEGYRCEWWCPVHNK